MQSSPSSSSSCSLPMVDVEPVQASNSPALEEEYPTPTPQGLEITTHDNEGSSRKRNAHWTGLMDKIFLEQLVQNKPPKKDGNNWLKRKQWAIISSVIQAKCQVKLDVNQLKNHLKFWKLKIKAFIELQKQSEFTWNPKTRTLTATPRAWSNYNKKNKNAMYWMNHEVLPLHEEVANWMGEELLMGEGGRLAVVRGDRAVNGRRKEDTALAKVEANQLQYSPLQFLPQNSASHSSQDQTSSTGNINNGKDRAFEKISIPLNRIANSIERMVAQDDKEDLPKRILEVLRRLPGIDSDMKFRAMTKFLDRPTLGKTFLSVDDEEKLQFLLEVLN